MTRFFIDDKFELHTQINLPVDIVQHIQVLRLKLDSLINIFNGDGYLYTARLSEIAKRQVKASIVSKQYSYVEPLVKINLYCSLLARDKFDLVIQKTVELGVVKIIPLITSRTQGINTQIMANKIAHWNKVSLMATEQCERITLTPVTQPILFHQAINETNCYKFILSPHHKNMATNLPPSLNPIAAFIGPEGGFTAEEIILALNNNCQVLQLGPRIMRAETAAIVAATLMQAKYGDLNF